MTANASRNLLKHSNIAAELGQPEGIQLLQSQGAFCLGFGGANLTVVDFWREASMSCRLQG